MEINLPEGYSRSNFGLIKAEKEPEGEGVILSLMRFDTHTGERLSDQLEVLNQSELMLDRARVEKELAIIDEKIALIESLKDGKSKAAIQ